MLGSGEALKLYALDHRGMVDDILYAGSIGYNLRLLTLGRKLNDLMLRCGLRGTLTLSEELT